MGVDIEHTMQFDMYQGDFKVYSKGIGESLKCSNDVIFHAEYAGDHYHDRYIVNLTIDSDTIEYINELIR